VQIHRTVLGSSGGGKTNSPFNPNHAPKQAPKQTQTQIQQHTHIHTHTYTHVCNLDVAGGNLCGVLLELCSMHYLAWPQRANVTANMTVLTLANSGTHPTRVYGILEEQQAPCLRGNFPVSVSFTVCPSLLFHILRLARVADPRTLQGCGDPRTFF